MGDTTVQASSPQRGEDGRRRGHRRHRVAEGHAARSHRRIGGGHRLAGEHLDVEAVGHRLGPSGRTGAEGGEVDGDQSGIEPAQGSGVESPVLQHPR